MKTGRYAPLAIIIAAALIIKLGYLFFAFPDPASVGRLSIDEAYHYHWASLVASGDIWVNAPYFRAPLYPLFLGLILAITGKSLFFVRLIQLLLGCVLVLFTYRLTERMAGSRAAVSASVLLILYPMTTYFEGELLLDFLFTLFVVLTVYFAAETDRDRPVLSGGLFALAALTRPTILVFFPVFLIYYLYRRRSDATFKSRLRVALLFALTAVVIISPITIINAVYSGQFILISYQGGINFYIGNNPEADGVTSDLPPFGHDWSLEDASYIAEQESGSEKSFVSQSYFWYSKGMRFIAENPDQFFGLFFRKLSFLFSGREISNNRFLSEAVFDNRLLSRLPVRFSLLIALAILPLFLAKRNRRSLLLCYGGILLYAAVVSLFFVSSRFRLPLTPFVALLSGWGIKTLWDTIQARQIGYRLFFAVTAAGVVFVFSTTAFPSRMTDNTNQALFLRGNRALRQGDYRTAISRFDSLIRRAPEFKNAHLNLGIAYLKMGQGDRAAEAFRSEIRHNPASAEAYNNLAAMYLLDNMTDSARHYSRRALGIKPYYTEAAINYLRAADDPAATDSIERFRRSFRTFNEDDPAYLFEEALYFTGRGMLDNAIANHLKILQTYEERPASISFEPPYQPERSRDYRSLAAYQLGYLYGLTGRYERSLTFSRQAIDLNPELKQAYVNLISAYRSLGRMGEADSVAAVFHSRWPDTQAP